MRSCRTIAPCCLRWLLWLACALAAPVWAGPWVDAAGRPTPAAHQATALLADAASEGLRPQDYAADTLARAVQAASQGPALDAARAALLDNALHAALQAYLADLHTGRIHPQAMQAGFRPGRLPAFDPGTFLQTALAAPALGPALRAAAPGVPQYALLRTALAQYRTLAHHPAWDAPLPPLPAGRKLEPGQAWPGLARLAQRLAALGDLPASTTAPTTYDAALQDAVRAFQQRHALAADGVLGRSTVAQLEVTPEQRAQQITVTMERLRWTPLQQAARVVEVNVPEFVLRAYEVRAGQHTPVLQMNVIVGNSVRKTHTPLFDEDMRSIEFNPYWNVPHSIAHEETVAHLRRNPAYFTQQGLEFVDAQGQAHTALNDADLEAVLQGQMRLRQRPGPRNALGDIKFVLPNSNSIYLHHTPSTGLFARERRDFSHGCIRVQDPVALAHFVLQDDPAWTPERIRQAMGRGRGQPHTVRLPQPVPVVIAYSTAVVKDGRVHFFADLYGQDRLLANALERESRARQAKLQAR